MRWIIISIDWKKAEEEPERIFKIEGKYLLDLRAKTVDLEKSIINYRDNTKKANEDLEKTNIELNNLKEEFKATTQVLEELKGHDGKLEDDLKSSLENIKELEVRLKDSNNKIADLETECENYRNQIVSKQKELESMKNEFEKKNTEKEKELTSMKTEFEAKNSEKEKELESMTKELTEISNIKDEYEKKIKDSEGKISDLLERNQTLETQMLQAINTPKLLKEIREILVSKGFISEMEFENIMKQK